MARNFAVSRPLQAGAVFWVVTNLGCVSTVEENIPTARFHGITLDEVQFDPDDDALGLTAMLSDVTLKLGP